MGQQFPAKEIVAFIGQIPLFNSCEVNDLFSLVEKANQYSYKSKSTILMPGRPVAGLGVMLRGRASLMLVDAANGSQTQIEQLSPGSFFGEVGLMLGTGNPLSVIADEECNALIIAKQDIEKLLNRNPEMCLGLAKRISARFVRLSMLGARSSMVPKTSTAPSPAVENDSDSQNSKNDGEIIWVEVGNYSITPNLLEMVPSQLIRKHRILPLKLTDKILTIGMVNPRSMEALQEIRRVLHTVDPEIVAISMDDYSQAFVRLKLDPGEIKKSAAGAAQSAQITYSVDQEKEADTANLYIGSEVINILDDVIITAIDKGASDIHIEPESTGVKVRYRVHGSLEERKEFMASSYAAPIIARIKVLSELDIAERRHPQDGRIFAKFGKQDVNLRVSTMPVARGEKAVIRIIDSADAMRPLSQIVTNPNLEKAIRSSIAEPYGAIVVAGPTGSGKSSTLYAMLNERRMSRPDNSIVTVEDPVEFLLPGVTQVPVVPRVNFGFADALHGMLRQDPDVIMIGELRDSNTTSIMVESALTGHLVLTSIHGNNGPSVIQRLQHLGTDPVMLSQALSIIIVQRLTKRLCPSCVKDSEVAPALIDNLIARGIISSSGTTKLPRPVGCSGCNNTGYLGRIAVQEVLNFDDIIRAALSNNVTPEELIATAKERKRFFSFAQSASYMMARRLLAPSDALMLVTD